MIDCPVCDQPMRREEMGGIHLDVCRSCKGVWFDHHELEAIWKAQAGMALERSPDGTRLARAGDDAGDVLLASLWYAPDLAFYGVYGAAHAVSGLAHAAGHVPDLVAAAPETAVHLVGAAGEAAGGVFDVIAGILRGSSGCSTSSAGSPGSGVRRASAAAAPSPCRFAAVPLPYRARGAAAAMVGPATGRARQTQRCRWGMAQALGISTSPGTGEVASLSEPERALSRSAPE